MKSGWKRSSFTARGTFNPAMRPSGILDAVGWSVVKVNDDGREYVVSEGMRPEAAESMAGRLRDGSSEREIEDGWNYVARNGKQTSISRYQGQ